MASNIRYVRLDCEPGEKRPEENQILRSRRRSHEVWLQHVELVEIKNEVAYPRIVFKWEKEERERTTRIPEVQPPQ